MQVLVMGAGAVGGYFGGVLSRAGHEVTLVARGDHLRAIRERGLRVESVTSGDFTVQVEAANVPDASSTADLVLFCVKSYDNVEAVSTIAPAVGSETAVLTLQNGLDAAEVLAREYGADRVLLGATYIDAMLKGPGVVSEHGGNCNIVFGREDGRRTDTGVAVYDALSGAGIDAQLSDSVTVELWSKLVFICALSGMSCIAQGSIAEVLDNPGSSELAWQVMREVEAVGRAKGVALDADVVEAKMAVLQAEKEDILSSMKTDLDRGYPLEVDSLNGAVARIGKQLGVATPVNRFIADCLMVPHGRAMAARDRHSSKKE